MDRECESDNGHVDRCWCDNCGRETVDIVKAETDDLQSQLTDARNKAETLRVALAGLVDAVDNYADYQSIGHGATLQTAIEAARQALATK